MLTQDQLIRTPEYWMERMQNDLYEALHKYMEEKQISKSQLAEELNVSKSYVSQLLNGNFNFTMSKLIEIALHMERAPVFEFKPLSAMDGLSMTVTPLDTTAMPIQPKGVMISIQNRAIIESSVSVAC